LRVVAELDADVLPSSLEDDDLINMAVADTTAGVVFRNIQVFKQPDQEKPISATSSVTDQGSSSTGSVVEDARVVKLTMKPIKPRNGKKPSAHGGKMGESAGDN